MVFLTDDKGVFMPRLPKDDVSAALYLIVTAHTSDKGVYFSIQVVL